MGHSFKQLYRIFLEELKLLSIGIYRVPRVQRDQQRKCQQPSNASERDRSGSAGCAIMCPEQTLKLMKGDIIFVIGQRPSPTSHMTVQRVNDTGMHQARTPLPSMDLTGKLPDRNELKQDSVENFIDEIDQDEVSETRFSLNE